MSVSKGRARPFSPAGLERAEFKRLIEDVGSAVTLHATTDLEFGELESGLLGELKPSRLAEPESIRLPGVGHDEQNAVTVAAPHDDAGRPHLIVTGTVAARAAALGVRHWHVSLSHDGGIASATVIAEGG